MDWLMRGTRIIGVLIRPVVYIVVLLAVLLGIGAVIAVIASSPEPGSPLGPPFLRLGIERDFMSPPQWSRDMNFIIFGKGGGLYKVDSSGSHLTLTPKDRSDDYRDVAVEHMVSPDSSRFVYASFQHNSWLPWLKTYQWEIVASDVDDSDRRRLTKSDSQEISPVWSPDGSRIAFLSDRTSNEEELRGRFHLFTMTPDGSNVQSIAPSVRQVEFTPPVWSLGSRHLAFGAGSTLRDGTLVLHSVGADGSKLTRLGDTTGTPAWSPDGSRIAFLRKDGDKTILSEIAPDGSSMTNVHVLGDDVTDRTRNITGHLTWSPDGTKILLSGKHAVGVVNADGSDFQLITNIFTSSITNLVASWSPDGSRIAVEAYVREKNPDFDIVLYTMEPDGSDKRILVRNRAGVLQAARGEPWSPKLEAPTSTQACHPKEPSLKYGCLDPYLYLRSLRKRLQT